MHLTNDTLKIVSLVPSASEIICDLGLEQYLVGVSHECNYPTSLRHIDSVTLSNIDSSKTQIEIDNALSISICVLLLSIFDKVTESM